jgi:hypothetical protein
VNLSTPQSTNVDRTKYQRDGYLHIKAAFSLSEVAEYRDKLTSTLSHMTTEIPTGDLLCNQFTAEFIQGGRLIEIAQTLLGGKPQYFGDSSCMVYDQDHAVCSFHKDNSDRHDANAPDWRGDYPLLRFGLYLQDHSRSGGGLMLRAGSHKSVLKNRKLEVLNEEVIGWLNGRTRYLPTEIGDLVVWNLRTTHAGMGRYIRGPIRRPITERTQQIFPKFVQSNVAGRRLALFATFGLAGSKLDRYLENLKMRSYMVEIWRNSIYTDENFNAFSKHGAKLLDLKSVIEAETVAGKVLGQNTHWQPLPY